ECPCDEALVPKKWPLHSGEYAVFAQDTEDVGLRDTARDVPAGSVIVFGKGKPGAGIARGDLVHDPRYENDRFVAEPVLSDPAGLDIIWIPQRTRGLQPCRDHRSRCVVPGDANAVAGRLRIPMQIEYVEQPLACLGARRIHTAQIKAEKVAAIGVGGALQCRVAVPAV